MWNVNIFFLKDFFIDFVIVGNESENFKKLRSLKKLSWWFYNRFCNVFSLHFSERCCKINLLLIQLSLRLTAELNLAFSIVWIFLLMYGPTMIYKLLQCIYSAQCIVTTVCPDRNFSFKSHSDHCMKNINLGKPKWDHCTFDGALVHYKLSSLHIPARKGCL